MNGIDRGDIQALLVALHRGHIQLAGDLDRKVHGVRYLKCAVAFEAFTQLMIKPVRTT